MEFSDPWLAAAKKKLLANKAMYEQAMAQLSDEELRRRPGPGFNSVATIVQHVAGNLVSRFTDFLATDGEKPNRNREGEFQDWPGSREELMQRWELGWSILINALDSLQAADINKTIYIRAQPHTVPEAVLRSVDHIGWHLGQILYISRMVCSKEWKYLTVAPGTSADFNKAAGLSADDRRKP